MASRAVAWLIGGLFASAALGQPSAVLSPDGYGAVRVGMSVRQAAKAFGAPLVAAQDDAVPQTDCYHLYPSQGPVELALMIQRGRVVRMSLYAGPSSLATDKGIRLGDAAATVKAAYEAAQGPTLQEQAHEYLGPAGRYLTWWDKRRSRGIRYEIDQDGRVSKIHAGGQAIKLVEGCS